MSGGGGGPIIIRRLLEDGGSRLTADERQRLVDILNKGEVVLSRLDSFAVASIAYELCRRP